MKMPTASEFQLANDLLARMNAGQAYCFGIASAIVWEAGLSLQPALCQRLEGVKAPGLAASLARSWVEMCCVRCGRHFKNSSEYTYDGDGKRVCRRPCRSTR